MIDVRITRSLAYSLRGEVPTAESTSSPAARTAAAAA
jgi:tRNA-2-methylthio-N6-dimethylallyladenosine synthase